MEPLQYGVDLWDSLHVIQMQADNRGKQLRALKSFFKSYRDSINYCQQSMQIAMKKLACDLDLPVLKQGMKSKDKDTEDTLSTAFKSI